MMEINEKANLLIETLHNYGYEAFVVGGCVRDSLLGKTPKDWDITTNAKTDEVLAVFKNYQVIPTGIDHGTVTVMVDGEGFEITTYRIDGTYLDGRHPETVTFTTNLQDDLSRRDFTINALAYNDKDGIVDPFGGIDDLKNGVIRCVGNASDRFNEDALRVLRALRFSSVLGFNIEEKTSEAILSKANKLSLISRERISSELIKILGGKGAYSILMKYRDVFGIIIPEIKPLFDFQQKNPYHLYDVWGHTAKVVSLIQNDPILKMAALLHDIGKPQTYTIINGVGHFYDHAKVGAVMAEKIMKELKFSRKEVDSVTTLVFYHDMTMSANHKFASKMVNKIGDANFKLLLDLRLADIDGQGVVIDGDNRKDILFSIKDILAKQTCFTLKDLQVNGNDLQQIGYKPGKEIGVVLQLLLDSVVDGKVDNTKKDLLDMAQTLLTTSL